jgi:hypothetical protein
VAQKYARGGKDKARQEPFHSTYTRFNCMYFFHSFLFLFSADTFSCPNLESGVTYLSSWANAQSTSVRLGLFILRGFHFAYAAIFAQVAGFGKSIVPLGRFGTGGGLGIRPELVQGLRENRRLQDRRKCGDGGGHIYYFAA